MPPRALKMKRNNEKEAQYYEWLDLESEFFVKLIGKKENQIFAVLF